MWRRARLNCLSRFHILVACQTAVLSIRQVQSIPGISVRTSKGKCHKMYHTICMALILKCCVYYEVLTKTIVNITVFSDVTLCNREGMYRFLEELAVRIFPYKYISSRFCRKWVDFPKYACRHIPHELIVHWRIHVLQTLQRITLKWVTTTSLMCFIGVVIHC